MSSDQPTMQFYDGDGKRVDEGDPSVRRQFLSDDPARPDATDEERAGSGILGARQVRTGSPTTAAAKTETPAATTTDGDPLAARRALVARAKELGLPASGKTAELEAAIADAEAKAGSGPSEIKAKLSPDEDK